MRWGVFPIPEKSQNSLKIADHLFLKRDHRKTDHFAVKHRITKATRKIFTTIHNS